MGGTRSNGSPRFSHLTTAFIGRRVLSRPTSARQFSFIWTSRKSLARSAPNRVGNRPIAQGIDRGNVPGAERGRWQHVARSRSGRMVPILPETREQSAKAYAHTDPLRPPAPERVEPSGRSTAHLDRALARKSRARRPSRRCRPRSFEHSAESAGANTPRRFSYPHTSDALSQCFNAEL